MLSSSSHELFSYVIHAMPSPSEGNVASLPVPLMLYVDDAASSSSHLHHLLLFLPRRHVDGDPGLRPLLGHGQRRDLRRHPLQRPGLRGRAQAGAEGEDGLNVCVWKAAAPRREPLLLYRRLAFLPSPPAAGLEPVLTPGGGEAGSGRQQRRGGRRNRASGLRFRSESESESVACRDQSGHV